MRAPPGLLALTTLLAACDPLTDPALGPCGTRKPAAFILGTGEEKFEPIHDTIEVQIGPPGQAGGGSHIWFAMRCWNMGPHVVAEFGVNHLPSGALLTPPSLRQAIDLEYNEAERADEVYGIRGFLAMDPFTDMLFTSHQVKLWVKMDDECKVHKEAEAVATVSGFHQL